ncbi:MAG: response regulator transcription factor [Oscillospiraceae bacterium]|nr:response regulator transcription factor [Oscillospiraceae bacterium]
MKQLIFIVEDDSALRELYQYSLENEFECRLFESSEPFFDAMGGALPDLILLDIMLPGDDGFAILSRLKAENATSGIPVLMVSARGDEVSKVKGLNMGADDYIGKPFGVLELIARIKANLRKKPKELQKSKAFKDIIIDNSKHQITANGKPLQMTLKEYNLLALLCAGAERVQTRDSIFVTVWGDAFAGESRTLDIHIKELRKKLAESGSEVTIKTIRGVGYMLV